MAALLLGAISWMPGCGSSAVPIASEQAVASTAPPKGGDAAEPAPASEPKALRPVGPATDTDPEPTGDGEADATPMPATEDGGAAATMENEAAAAGGSEAAEGDGEDAWDEPPREPLPKLPAPEGATRLSPDYDIWVHKERGEVIIDGAVSLRRGMLEMFACLPNTKEHESVVSANTQAFAAHAALLSLGAEPGSPVRWGEDDYQPPTGAEIAIEVRWRGADGQMKSTPAQQWVRDVESGKAMSQVWVFAGSGLWKHPDTGEEFYMAEGGDFICVSNFGSAMLDVPAESTQANGGLLFEAFTENIPPLGTPVRMVLRPKLPKDAEAAPASE
ncbi:MAG: YdjY domain-containing protein [Planctomycetota bacterium]